MKSDTTYIEPVRLPKSPPRTINKGVPPKDDFTQRKQGAGLFEYLPKAPAPADAGKPGLFSTEKNETLNDAAAPDGKNWFSRKVELPPPPPFTMDEYLSPRSFNPAIAGYMNGVQKYIEGNDLDKLLKFTKPENILGQGGAKVCYRYKPGLVLLVHEKPSTGSLEHEYTTLKLMEKKGLPVPAIFKLGTVPSRNHAVSGAGKKDPCMVQEELQNFINFRQLSPAQIKEFVNSPLTSERTLQSLVRSRNIMKNGKFDIIDAQGGLRMSEHGKGEFVFTDPVGLVRTSREKPFNHMYAEEQEKNMNAVIAGLRKRFPHVAV